MRLGSSALLSGWFFLALWSSFCWFCTEANVEFEHVKKDRVYSLPGYSMPMPSPLYSGYLSYEYNGHVIHTHYILLLAEKDYQDKPLLFWMNGGPGASSMYGFMTELGPFIMSERSLQTDDYRETGIPSPIYNEYTWSKLGSLVMFDAPAPTGFSYCDNGFDPKIKVGYSCGNWNDEKAAVNNHLALKTFYEKFPMFAKHPLYIIGESYAGIYIPTLIRRIMKDKDEMIKDLLRGFAVGDGCLGYESNICADMFADNSFFNALFFGGHHQMPVHTLARVIEDCGMHGEHSQEPACKATNQLMKDQVGGFFQYHLYDDCIYEDGLLKSSSNDYSCGGGDIMNAYVAREDVLDALHIPNVTSFYITDDAKGFDYTMFTEPNVMTIYQAMAEYNHEHQEHPVRMLVYNGDADPRINSFDTQNWTEALGFEVLEDWRPWTIDECIRMGGYVTRYHGHFDFLTVRAAGHMVPTYKPAATFTFVEAFVHNQHYPTYNPSCTDPSKN